MAHPHRGRGRAGDTASRDLPARVRAPNPGTLSMATRGASPLLSLFLLTLIFLLNFFSRIFFSPLLPELEHALRISHGQAGFFFFLISCGYFLSLSGSGLVSARLGHKLTIISSMTGISLSLALMALAPSLPLIHVCLFLLGLSAGIYLPSGIATISSLFPPRRWGRAFSIHELAPNLAFVLAPVFVSLLLARLDWQQTILVLVPIILGATAAYGRFGSTASTPSPTPNPELCLALFREKDFWLMVLLFSMGITSTLGIYSILPTFLVAIHQFPEQSANLLVGGSRLPTLITVLAAGALADWIGNRRTISLVLLASGLATAMLGLAHDQVRLLIWLQPLLAVCFFPAGFALLARIGPAETRSVTVSLTVPLSFVIGGGVVPALVTRLADLGHFPAGITSAGLFILLGGFLVFLVRPPAESGHHTGSDSAIPVADPPETG